MYEFHFRLARSFIQGRANLVMPLADRPARGVDDAKDLERNRQAIVSAHPVSSPSPGLMGSSCHSSNERRPSGCACLCARPPRDGLRPRAERHLGQSSRLRGRARSSATRVAPTRGCNVRTDKLKRARFEAGAEQARLKVITWCEIGASNPSLI